MKKTSLTKPIKWFAVFIFILSINHLNAQTTDNGRENDRKVLLEFQEALHSKGWPELWDEEQVKQKMEHWQGITVKDNRVTEISISGRRLNDFKTDTLPPSIGILSKLESLKGLSLAILDLKVLPKELWSLNKLTSLSLVYNKLNEIPSEINQLNKLEFLLLDENNLTDLPSLRALSELTYLSISGNKTLKSIPSSVFTLTELTFLDIGWTSIEKIPDEIGQLKQLETLRAANAEVKTISYQIQHLKELKELYISSNKLEKLTNGITKAEKLEQLDANRNQLTALPKKIGDLKKLKSIDVSYNQLSQLPESMKDLYSLTSIKFDKNLFTTFPHIVTNIPKINMISGKHNQMQGPIPTEVFSRTDLSLYLEGNNLSGEIVIGRSSIQRLFIRDNKFTFKDIINEYDRFFQKNIYGDRIPPYLEFEPQKNIGTPQTFRPEANKPFVISVDGYSPANGCQFTWYKRNVLKANAVVVSDKEKIEITSLAPATNNGIYHCVVKHPKMKDVTLISNPIKVIAQGTDKAPIAKFPRLKFRQGQEFIAWLEASDDFTTTENLQTKWSTETDHLIFEKPINTDQHARKIIIKNQNWTGTDTLRVEVTDEAGNTTSIKAPVTVVPQQNQTPTFTKVPTVYMNIDKDINIPCIPGTPGCNYMYPFTSRTVLSDYVSDDLTHPINLSYRVLNVKNSDFFRVGFQQAALSVDVFAYQDTTFTLTVEIEDEEGSKAMQDLKFVCYGVNRNQSPVWTNIPEQIIKEGTATFPPLNLSNYVTDDYSPVEDLIWFAPWSDNKLNVEVDANGEVTVSPTDKGENYTAEQEFQVMESNNKRKASITVIYKITDEPTVRGTILDKYGKPLAGVKINGLPSTPITNSKGKYYDHVSAGWSGTIKPEKQYYTFDPVQKEVKPITSDVTENFTATIVQYTVSGQILDENNNPLANVALSGFSNNVTTNANGEFSTKEDREWKGTITPSLYGYSFVPQSFDITSLTSDITKDIRATRIQHVISGEILDKDGTPLSNVTLKGFTKSVKTNALGKYSTTEYRGWTGTITPELTDYLFIPENVTITQLEADVVHNFKEKKVQHTISGKIVDENKAPLKGVELKGFSTTVFTDTDGEFSVKKDRRWSGTVTPKLFGYSFTPTERDVSSLNSDLHMEFSANKVEHTISGKITDKKENPIQGVELKGFTQQVFTDANGEFSTIEYQGWTETITPTHADYTFTPANVSINKLDSDKTLDFEGKKLQVTISGRVTDNEGNALDNVEINGFTQNVTTNANGEYTTSEDKGWSGIITANSADYTFSPKQANIGPVNANTTQNFKGTKIHYEISGTILDKNKQTVQGVVLEGFSNDVKTDADGKYSTTEEKGWTGTIVPKLNDYDFNPLEEKISNLNANTQVDFSATKIISYTISVTVQDKGGKPLNNVHLNGFSKNATTDTNGKYTTTELEGWSGTIKPELAGYSFSPEEFSISGLKENKDITFNTTQIVVTYTLSGTVKEPDGSPIAGVKIKGFTHPDVTTDANGNYIATELEGWYGTIEPQHKNYTFSPLQINIGTLTRDRKNLNFTGTKSRFAISGTILDQNNKPLQNVALTGFSETVKTDADGKYSTTENKGWSGIITPTLDNYTFDPTEVTIDKLDSDKEFDFKGAKILITYTLDGTVTDEKGKPIVGVKITGFTQTDITTDADGNYTTTEVEDWSGTIKPEHENYTFDPSEIKISALQANKKNLDFEGARIQFTISGTILDKDNRPLPNVTLAGFSQTVNTDTEGKYSTIEDKGWSGTITPELENYTFDPQKVTINELDSNKEFNFDGARIQFTVSGTILDKDNRPLPNVTLAGFSQTVNTDAEGKYSTTEDKGWSGTITPELENYTFAPQKVTINELDSDKEFNFNGARIQFTVSGTILDKDNRPLPNVTLAGFSQTVNTDAEGKYSTKEDKGWSGTITPELENYTFAPQKVTINELDSNKEFNFDGTRIQFTVSGTILDKDNRPLPNVTLAGFSQTVNTDAEGKYSTTEDTGWSGTITPELENYTFDPQEVTINKLDSDREFNFKGTKDLTTYTLSGTVTDTKGNSIANVKITGFTQTDITTDADGNYTTTEAEDWSGTIKPEHESYTFTPSEIKINALQANNADLDFEGVKIQYIVSGTILDQDNQPLSNVNLIGFSQPVKTDTDGKYSTTENKGWSGTITPELENYRFDPQKVSISDLNSNKVFDFLAIKVVEYTISVTIVDSGDQPLAGVKLKGLSDAAVTDPDGKFSISKEQGWTGTIEPYLTGYAFSPTEHKIDVLNENATISFTATKVVTYTIEGVVTEPNGTPLVGIQMAGFTDESIKTDINGKYIATEAAGWYGSINPVSAFHSFAPAVINISPISRNRKKLNFTGTRTHFSISVSVYDKNNFPIEGATLKGFSDKQAITDANGNYTAIEVQNWNGTITAEKGDYAFTPVSFTIEDLSKDETFVFNEELNIYTISGTVTNNTGEPLPNVVLTGFSSTNVETDANGNYTTSENEGWSGTIIPTLDGVTFSPTSIEIKDLSTNKTVNFSEAKRYRIYGRAEIFYLNLPIPDVEFLGFSDPNVTTNKNGEYSTTEYEGWSGTVTLESGRFSFSEDLTITSLQADVEKNFSGSYKWLTVSGKVERNDGKPVQGVILKGLSESPKTNEKGIFEASETDGKSITITPELDGYIFSPESITIESLNRDTTFDFEATPDKDLIKLTPTISMDGNFTIKLSVPSAKVRIVSSDGLISFEEIAEDGQRITLKRKGIYVVTALYNQKMFRTKIIVP